MPSVSDVSEMPARWLVRGVVALVVLSLVASSVMLTLAYTPPQLQPGAVEDPANGTTIVGVQGFHFQGQGNNKKPARLVAAGENANIKWVYDGSSRGASWFYDVDPLPNGNVLAVNTNPQGTDVYELDPDTKERVWEVHIDIKDTHDVDLINGDQLLVANMRNWNKSEKVSNDRLVIYDIGEVMANGSSETIGEDEVVWEWYFKNHYPKGTDGGMKPDWTHVNDVDKIGPGQYMASPRNFDQTIVVNRSTKEITMQLGSDGNHDVMFEQHNPTYLETDDGKPTILVADSENNRVVEYTCTARFENGSCDWEEVWEVGEGQLNWPRDADRLPNGNTLIVDTRGHRVVEVTPKGQIVWEAYTPWAPFDAERMAYGDEAMGTDRPAMRDLGVSGSYELDGSAGLTPGTEGGKQTFPQWLRQNVGWLPGAHTLADLWQAGGQWIKPVWMAPWTMVHGLAAVLLLLGWGVAELVYQRQRVVGAVRGVAGR